MSAITEERVLEALVTLGDTPEQIAQSLIAKGITGDQKMAGSCPLANYLVQEIPEAKAATIYTSAFVFRTTPEEEQDDDDGDRGVKVRTPGEHLEFMDAFDNGAYPALVTS